MKKIIEPTKPEIAEYYCDACKQLVLIDGLPEDQIPIIEKEFSVALQGNFGHTSNTAGFFFNLDLCETCGWKLVKATEELFNIKVQSPEFESLKTEN